MDPRHGPTIRLMARRRLRGAVLEEPCPRLLLAAARRRPQAVSHLAATRQRRTVAWQATFRRRSAFNRRSDSRRSSGFGRRSGFRRRSVSKHSSTSKRSSASHRRSDTRARSVIQAGRALVQRGTPPRAHRASPASAVVEAFAGDRGSLFTPQHLVHRGTPPRGHRASPASAQSSQLCRAAAVLSYETLKGYASAPVPAPFRARLLLACTWWPTDRAILTSRSRCSGGPKPSPGDPYSDL